MKSAEEVIWELVDAHAHMEKEPACHCDRCKKGRELFILPSDINRIYADALRHAAAECRRRVSRLKTEAYNVSCDECAVFIEAEAQRLTNEKR